MSMGIWQLLPFLFAEEAKPYPANGVNAAYPESRYTSDYFISKSQLLLLLLHFQV